MRRRGLLGLPSALAAPLRLLVLLALLPVTRAIYTLEMFRQPSEAVAGLPFGVQPAVALYDDVSLSSALSSTDGAAGLRGAAGVGGIGMSIMPPPATYTRGTGTSDLGFGGTAGICGWSEGQPIMPHGCCGPGGSSTASGIDVPCPGSA